MRSALVLGAGMVGVASALSLQAAGYDVALVDRGPPGRETSYGCAGVIQAEVVEPYALPRDPASILRIAMRRGNDVEYHLAGLPPNARVLWQYFRASAPARHRKISAVYAELTRRATDDHAPLICAARAEALVQRQGFYQLHRSTRSFDHAEAEAERFRRDYGVRSDALSGAQMRRAEPALQTEPAGAIHWLDAWTCSDPGALVDAYAALFAARGGQIVRADARTLRRARGGWTLSTEDGCLSATTAVVALGPWSPDLLALLGYRVPMILKRGYHRHYENAGGLTSTIVDVANGTVLAPMARGIRLTTGAEIAASDTPASPSQLERGERAAADLIRLGAAEDGPPWMGRRPCMADMLPVVGPAPSHPDLWFNFGHGHQGFTLGPTTASLLVQEMETGAPVHPELGPYRRVVPGPAGSPAQAQAQGPV